MSFGSTGVPPWNPIEGDRDIDCLGADDCSKRRLTLVSRHDWARTDKRIHSVVEHLCLINECHVFALW
jgi:hypothetical protein